MVWRLDRFMLASQTNAQRATSTQLYGLGHSRSARVARAVPGRVPPLSHPSKGSSEAGTAAFHAQDKRAGPASGRLNSLLLCANSASGVTSASGRGGGRISPASFPRG